MRHLKLGDEDLELRRARMSEAPLLARAVRDSLPELGEFLPWADASYDAEVARGFLRFCAEQAKAERSQHLSIFGCEDGALLGGVSLDFRRAFQSAELGYWVRSDRAGAGIATQAAGLMMAAGFERFGLRRIFLTCDVANRGSRRVAEKLGMRREGRLREYVLRGEEPRDHHLYALLAREFRPAHRG